MTTITINLDDDVARYVEESASREQKSVSDWIQERLTPEANRATRLQSLEAIALANGYPPGWLTLFGSLADDDSFAAPTREPTRSVSTLNI